MVHKTIIAALALTTILSGCATAPRGPAVALGKAGDDTAAGIARDTRATAAALEYADVTEAFVLTWNGCSAAARSCRVREGNAKLSEERRQLGNVIRLRARVAQTLADAYEALKIEGEYDGKADLQGAADEAVSGVTAFAGAVAALPGAGAAGGQALLAPIGAATRFGTGVFAEQKQRQRVLTANRRIAGATERLRNAMIVEQAVFAQFAEAIGQQRTAARLAMVEAGIASSASVLGPMADELGIVLRPTADAAISASPRAFAAFEATLTTQSRVEIAAVKARYALCIEALDELLDAHVELEQAGAVSLTGLTILLGDLNAELDRYIEKKGEE